MQSIVTEDMDEQLVFTKEKLKPKLADALAHHALEQLKFLDYDVRVAASPHNKSYDSLWTTDIFDTIANEEVPYRILRSHFNLNGQPIMLELSTSLVDRDELLKSILKVEVILLLLFILGLYLINRNLSRRIWQPFYSTLEKLKNYKVDKHQPLALPQSSIKEFNDLNHSLEDLTEGVNKTYLSQKEFTENASHEMQTPLAVFQSKLELLMQTSPLNEEQAVLIDELSDAGRRMSRLNRSLILLTRIENHQFVEIENNDVQKIADRLLRDYEPQINQKQLKVSRHFNDPSTIKAHPALMEILISNLLGNAIKHNKQGGIIDIEISRDQLVVRNSGDASVLDSEKIFERFEKGNSNNNGIGLGLEIARQICHLYGFKISYIFASEQHEFVVKFN